MQVNLLSLDSGLCVLRLPVFAFHFYYNGCPHRVLCRDGDRSEKEQV